MNYYTNKWVWITGATSGIGEHLAYAFAEAGAKLVLFGRNEGALARIQAACKGAPTVLTHALDIAQHEAIPAVLQKMLAHTQGGIDILVNNAGISQRALAKDSLLHVDRQMMEVNYLGTVAVTKALLPTLLAVPHRQIVVITSITGKIGTPLRSSYAASKHALHGFFETLRAEVPDTLHITLLCPGFVQTNISKNALTADGSPQNTMDTATAAGLTPAAFSQKALRAIAARRAEVIISGFKERLAVWLWRFTPSLLRRIIKNAKVT